MHVEDATNYMPKWLATLITVILAALAVIANVITMTVSSGAWLGLNEIQWHWVLLACAILVALNAAVNRAVLTLPPTNRRKIVEAELDRHERMRLSDPQLRHVD
jgi:uncharacterized membrane protein YbhN (UPF0104 family)